jgi:biopolymer transport protein ExbD
MVTAKLVVSRALPMDLPKAATGGEVQQIFSVSLLANGTRQVDGSKLEDDRELFGRAQAALHEHPELRAVVQADGNVAHREVMRALDVLRQAGLKRVAFAILPGGRVSEAK